MHRRAPAHDRDDAIGRLHRGPVRQHDRPAGARRRAAVPRLQPGHLSRRRSISAWRAAARRSGAGERRGACSACAISACRRAASARCATRGAAIRAPRLAGAGERHRDRQAHHQRPAGAGRATSSIASPTCRSVWVIADVAESDLAAIKLGTRATRHVARLSDAADRGRGDLHLSGGEAGDAHGAGAHRGAESRTGG